MCSDMDCWAGIPWAVANPEHQEGHSRVLAKPLYFLLVRVHFWVVFLVPKTQQCFKRAHEVVYLFLNQC